ncbi:MAG: hypothetical protein U0637_03810 [Phycisphaerales bacterium]
MTKPCAPVAAWMMVGAVALVGTGGAASTARADVVQMTFTGPIQFSNMSAFPAGQLMTVTFTYESSGAPQFIANQQAFYVDHMLSISVQSGSYAASDAGGFGQIDKYDNLGNTDGIQYQVAALQPTYQYTNPKPQTVQFPNVLSNSISQSFQNLIVNYASPSSAVWSDYTLPTTYNDALFNGTRNMLFGFSDGSFQVGNMTVTSQIVPAPGALALLGLAGLAARRRR